MTSTFTVMETTPTITELLALGVSGGKDSDIAAAKTLAYLKRVGHLGPCILIHSDLGRIEWKDSLPACERLVRRYDLELVMVKRQVGDLICASELKTAIICRALVERYPVRLFSRSWYSDGKRARRGHMLWCMRHRRD